MSQLIQSGGVQTVTQLNQIVYLDFDGEYTSYNGEILNVDGVVVEDSKLSGERIAEIVAALNEKYAPAGVNFVTERPIDGEYSTVYVGKTDDFDQYGNFAGLAETIDKGNANKSDKAFVILDSTASNAQIVDTISHETDHLLGTLDHDGDGLERYAAYLASNGIVYNDVWLDDVMHINSKGVANNTWVVSQNYLFVHNGGVANSTRLLDGVMNICSRGYSTSTTVKSNGIMNISEGGKADNINASGGKIYISSGATADNITANSNAVIYIFSGAHVTNIKENGGFVSVENSSYAEFAKNSFGNIYLSNHATIHSGTTATDITICQGGIISLYSKGLAQNIDIDSNGFLHIKSGGTASNVNVKNGGVCIIDNCGIVDNISITSGVNFSVSSGGSAINIHWTPCVGTIDAEKGAYITFAETYNGVYLGSNDQLTSHAEEMSQEDISGSMYIMNGGIATSINILSGGYAAVSGGSASNVTVSHFGKMQVECDGKADQVSVHNSGSLEILAGATVQNVRNGGVCITEGYVKDVTLLENGSMNISSGGQVENIEVSVNARLSVLNGGSASITYSPWNGEITAEQGATVLYNSPDANVYYGNIKSGIIGKYDSIDDFTITDGNSMCVFSQGIVNSVSLISSGVLYLFSGAIANNTDLLCEYDRCNIYISGGTASNTTLTTSGKMYIESGYAYNTQINGTGDIIVKHGGFAEENSISQGWIDIHAGGSAKYTQIFSNACMFVSSLGSADFTTISRNAKVYVTGGEINNTTISAGGSCIMNYGDMINTNIKSGGSLLISSGNISNTDVASGGSLSIIGPCTLSSTTMSYGYLELPSGCNASDTYIAWGYLYCSATSEIKDTLCWGGYLHLLDGATAYNTKNQAGHLYVSGNAAAYNTILEGSATVMGYMNNTVVSSAGVMYITDDRNVGGSAANTYLHGNAVMHIGQNGKHQGELKIYDNAVVSAYGGIIDFTVCTRNINDDYLINNLALIFGTPTYTITVSEDQAYGTYKLAQGAEQFTGSILIGNENINYGNITVNGDDLISDDTTYSLDLIDGNLTLTVFETDLIPPEKPKISADVTELTKGDVVVFATFSTDIVKKEYSLDNRTWMTYTSGVVMEENGTIYFRGQDEAGNVSAIANYEVSNIDKVAPTLDISSDPDTWTNQDVVLTASVSDGSVEYFNGSDWIAGNSLTVTENGIYQFRVTDAAGNVTEKSVVVDKIDKVAPTIDIHLSSNNWTHNAVTANTMFNDDLSGVSEVEYSFNAQDWIVGTSATVQNNGTIYWKATDFAGNVSYTSSVVSNIVAIDPETESPVHVYSGGLLIKDGVSFDNEHITSDLLMYVTSGGIANNTTVNGGSLAVHDGAKVTGVTFRKGGTMNYYGGTAYNVELGYGGIMTIESGAVRNGQIADKGQIFVSNGGVASGTIIKNGGVQHVLSGGSADDTQIWLNGIVQVSSGAVVTDMLTKHGAKVHVFGGTISNTTMERGITSVYQGGTAVETEVGYGAYLMLGFTSYGCSGVASSYDTTVLSGGGLTVMSGAVAEDNVIYGTLNCNNGGILLGETTIHSRANLAGNAVVTDETSITFDVSGREVSAMQESYYEAMLNSYYVAREADMTISVSADQAEGSYILANWALEAKKGTFTLEVDGTEVGTFSTTKSLTYDGKIYSLYCFDDSTNSKALTLKVCDATSMDAWTDLGSGDFDGDGIEESLVSDGTNLYAASEDLWLGNLSGTEEIASIVDYNNDGTDDLLIHNTATDQMTAWLVKDGATYSTLAIA